MLAASYPTKKALRESVGNVFQYEETSMFGPECKSMVWLTVVGPSPTQRKWFANVLIDNDHIILKVK